MTINQIVTYKRAFESVMENGECMRVLVEAFVRSEPLNTLAIAARSAYCKHGVRRASVMKDLRNSTTLKTYGKLQESGLIDGPSVDEFLGQIDQMLKCRKKIR